MSDSVAAPAAAPVASESPTTNSSTNSGGISSSPNKAAAPSQKAAASVTGTSKPGSVGDQVAGRKGEAPAAASEAKPADKPKYKFKTKVDKQEVEEEYDETEIVSALQMKKASQKRMQEAASAMKERDEIRRLISENNVAELEKSHGFKGKEYYEKQLAQEYESFVAQEREANRQKAIQARLAALPDEERALFQEQQKALDSARKQADAAAKHEAEAKQLRHADQARRQKILDMKTFKATETDLLSALEKAGVEKDYEALYEIAALQRANLDFKQKLTPEQLATEMREKREASRERVRKVVMEKMDGGKLLEYLGADAVEKILRAKLEEYSASKPYGEQAPAATPAPKEEPALTPGRARRRAALGY